MYGHADIVKLLIEGGQADVNIKDDVSHSNCVTSHIIGSSFDDEIVQITSYEVNKSIRHMS